LNFIKQDVYNSNNILELEKILREKALMIDDYDFFCEIFEYSKDRDWRPAFVLHDGDALRKNFMSLDRIKQSDNIDNKRGYDPEENKAPQRMPSQLSQPNNIPPQSIYKPKLPSRQVTQSSQNPPPTLPPQPVQLPKPTQPAPVAQPPQNPPANPAQANSRLSSPESVISPSENLLQGRLFPSEAPKGKGKK
jgi:hypothetical protein